MLNGELTHRLLSLCYQAVSPTWVCLHPPDTPSALRGPSLTPSPGVPFHLVGPLVITRFCKHPLKFVSPTGREHGQDRERASFLKVKL